MNKIKTQKLQNKNKMVNCHIPYDLDQKRARLRTKYYNQLKLNNQIIISEWLIDNGYFDGVINHKNLINDAEIRFELENNNAIDNLWLNWIQQNFS